MVQDFTKDAKVITQLQYKITPRTWSTRSAATRSREWQGEPRGSCLTHILCIPWSARDRESEADW